MGYPRTVASPLKAERLTGEWILNPEAPALHLWVPEDISIILGASQTAENEVDEGALKAYSYALAEASSDSGIQPVFIGKRRGGGGAVVLNPHCLCLAWRFPRKPAQGPLDYFRHFNGALLRALATLSPGIAGSLDQNGISDIVLGDRKLVGTSLYLSREVGLYLASILVEKKAYETLGLLRQPGRQPEYRRNRTHREFLITLEEAGYGDGPEALKERLQRELQPLV